jgi:hypothetical protein
VKRKRQHALKEKKRIKDEQKHYYVDPQVVKLNKFITNIYENTIEVLKKDVTTDFNYTKKVHSAVKKESKDFIKRQFPWLSECNYLYWGFDNFNKGKFAHTGQNKWKDGYELVVLDVVKYKLPPKVVLDRLMVSGYIDQGFRFVLSNYCLEADFSEIKYGKPISVCFWLKIIEKSKHDNIFSYGLGKDTDYIKIELNKHKEKGERNSLIIRTMSGYLTGTTVVRDGSWHHIAVIYNGNTESDVKNTTFLYINGSKEEPSYIVNSKKDYREMNIITVGMSPRSQKQFINLHIDELYVFDIVLSKSQVNEVMKKK